MFDMFCPECEESVPDIEGSYIECFGTEEFWGARVSTDDSEFEVGHIPACETCGRVTLTDDQVTDFFWQNVYGDLGWD